MNNKQGEEKKIGGESYIPKDAWKKTGTERVLIGMVFGLLFGGFLTLLVAYLVGDPIAEAISVPGILVTAVAGMLVAAITDKIRPMTKSL